VSTAFDTPTRFISRQGVPLKSIGDLLGHRSPESTAVYLRLATEDLRTVAVALPSPIVVPREERQ
jgi:hypothetical protein